MREEKGVKGKVQELLLIRLEVLSSNPKMHLWFCMKTKFCAICVTR